MRTVVFLVLLGAALQPLCARAADTDADKAMARRISSHIQQSGQLRNYRIGVTCENGVANLAGSVSSPEQRSAAIRLAEQISGVSQVNCRLEIAGAQAELASGTDATRSNVVHAMGNQPIAAPRPHMARRSSNQMQARRLARNNMPLPSRMQDVSLRQASAQNVVPAGCNCGPSGYAGGPMGPEGMMGGGMAGGGMGMGPAPAGFVPTGSGRGPSYENAQMPNYAWPSYASYPNYAALQYPQQYSPTAWPYIGPFYPYPQVPLAWRKVSLEWDDGWWFLDFSAHNSSH